MKPFPTFDFELPYWENNTYVIGLDEVGRGCLAGPVFVGGVCIPFITLKEQQYIKKLKIHDSKLCTEKKRIKLSPLIKDFALCWHIASSTVDEINSMGIVPAIEKAECAIIEHIASKLPSNSQFIVFTDTLPIKSLKNSKKVRQTAIPQGDGKCITIASASIIAKVERDQYMCEIHKLHPHYGWDHNKGYSTKSHKECIKKAGVSPLHRTLFLRKLFAV